MKLLCLVGLHRWRVRMTSTDGEERILTCVRCGATGEQGYLGADGAGALGNTGWGSIRYVRPPMSDADREANRRSFAYGNCAIDNPNVTRELVDRVADEMKHTDGEVPPEDK